MAGAFAHVDAEHQHHQHMKAHPGRSHHSGHIHKINKKVKMRGKHDEHAHKTGSK